MNTQQRGPVAQNDIADLLQKLIDAFGLSFLQPIADWFEGLDEDGSKPWKVNQQTSAQTVPVGLLLQLLPFILQAIRSGAFKAQSDCNCDYQSPTTQGLLDGECFGQLTDGLQQAGIKAGQQFANDTLAELQRALECLVSGPQQPVQAQQVNAADIASAIDIGCAIKAVFGYLQSKDLMQAILAYLQCAGLSGGGQPTNPDPGMPQSPWFRPVARC